MVTGASSGIGAATAGALAAEGAIVALVARRLDRLEELAREIGESGGTALPIEADVTDLSAAESVVARTVSEYGALDILVNNAGVMLLGPILDAPVEEWQRMVESTCSACSTAPRPPSRTFSRRHRTTRAVLPTS